ncbi:MAG: hypothetical protein JF597_45165 [Streptomyces sp.]|jgi:hypothetical protein|uniref:hypothetical protein n=1 Tax=Streptomyces sp. TaxID=1931 RepID=UPI0025DBDCCA|nr:hypothetical protein [Streptomyces sp.]MBW8800513.1 hypothetical protein [Streptomyces sp.]
MHTTQRQFSRALAAGALSVALLSAGSAGAFGTEAKPAPSPTMSAKPHPKPSPTTMASISIKASTASVKAGDSVTFTGRTSGLKVGWPLVLQHQKGGKWIPLKATAKVKNGSSYSLTGKLNNPGSEHLRVAAVGKKVYSPTVTVNVG